MASAVQVSPAEDTDILGTLMEIGSPPPGNPPPPDRGLNDSVYANLDNLVREKASTATPAPDLSSAPGLDLPSTAVAALAKTATTPTTPAAPATAATTAPSLPLKKRNNILSLLNTADNLREQVELAEMSK